MRRRITIALLGTLAAALLLAGGGTLLLNRASARHDTESTLRRDAEGIAPLLARGAAFQPGVTAAQRRQATRQALQKLRLQGIGIVVINAKQGLTFKDLPDGVTEADIDTSALMRGITVSGGHGNLVYAIAPRNLPRGGVEALILTRPVRQRPAATGWFLLASAVTLAIGTVVAVRLSGTLTRPLRQADLATRRIAAGDLSARVPAPKVTADDELADLSRSINTMAEALERSRGLERQFLLSVSHDLRTPLTSIRGYAEAITDGTAPDTRAAAGVILSESRRLERLVRDLLDLAKLEARRFSLHPRPVSLAEVVAEVAGGFRREIEAAGLVLVLDPEPESSSGVAAVDTDRFAQVVANLMENALKYAATAIRTGVVAHPEQVVAYVADDGPGIAPADLPHVFERLYVAQHQPVRRESGSGLGLAIVRELVAAMGGTISAESPPEGGTRMVLRFPATRPAFAATGAPS